MLDFMSLNTVTVGQQTKVKTISTDVATTIFLMGKGHLAITNNFLNCVIIDDIDVGGYTRYVTNGNPDSNKCNDDEIQ